MIVIPKANEKRDNYPSWKATVDGDGNNMKPVIYCKCGQPCSIEHSIDDEGNVTPSFHHVKKEVHELQDGEVNGCGFHDHLKLEGFQLFINQQNIK